MAHSRQFIPLAQARAPFFVGVDVGGTNIKIGAVDDEGRPLSWTSLPTEQERGPQDAIGRVGEALKRVIGEAGLEKSAIARVGLGTPGTMDVAQGVLLEPGNLPQAAQRLERKEILVEEAGQLSFRIDLLRRWLDRHRDLESFLLSGQGGP